MNSQMIATIRLMEKGFPVYTIKLDNLQSYDFIWDNEKLCTLHLVAPNLSIKDLNALIEKPYDSYVLIGIKRVLVDGQEKTFDIPARVFKHTLVKGDNKTIDMTFYETWGDKNGN